MTNDEMWLLREKYHGEKTEGFSADCDRLKNGEPLAYIIGHVPFMNTTIHLDSRPLIPRPETEHWVESAIKELHAYGGRTSVRVLDLCAGSGCIGVAVLTNVPNASVDFVEIDGEHHETIKKNIRENGIERSRVQIFGGDLFLNVHDTYDCILANPPYIDPALDRTEESVRAYEPKGALYGGPGGMELIERIVKDAPGFLTEHGTLYMEHEPEQAEAIRELGERNGFLVTNHEDQYGVKRLTKLIRTGH
jgi:release factor glutamine methyltransferase